MGAAPSQEAPTPCLACRRARAAIDPDKLLGLIPWLRSLARSDVSKTVWGNVTWDHIHCRTIRWKGGPKGEAILQEQRYLQALFEALPCAECRMHATSHYWAHIPNLSTNLSYQTWAFDFHNSVNARLGKAHFSQQAYDEFYLQERLNAHHC
jgi:hypothetical protein